jgi:hypothetical protein
MVATYRRDEEILEMESLSRKFGISSRKEARGYEFFYTQGNPWCCHEVRGY